MTDICGLKTGWATNYSNFHRESLQMHSASTKYLVAVPNLSGMADRVIGFVTVLMMSILTNRVFQLGNRVSLPIFEEAFFSPNNVNWSRPIDADWIIEPLKYKANPRNFNSTILSQGEYFAVNTIDDFKLQDRLLRQDLNQLLGGNAKTTFISINRGKTIRMFENPHHVARLTSMGLTSYTAFGCLLNYLVQPKPEVFLPVQDLYEKMTNSNPRVLKITIQIRVGDSSLSSPDSKANVDHYSAFFSCAEQIEAFATEEANRKNQPYEKVLWFLASDSKALRSAAVERYGAKILTALNSTLEHTAKEHCVGFHLAAAEWWLMAHSNYFIISQSLVKDTTYTVTYKRNASPIRCDNRSFTDLETFSYDWSGI
eukprot:gene25064-32683_t